VCARLWCSVAGHARLSCRVRQPPKGGTSGKRRRTCRLATKSRSKPPRMPLPPPSPPHTHRIQRPHTGLQGSRLLRAETMGCQLPRDSTCQEVAGTPAACPARGPRRVTSLVYSAPLRVMTGIVERAGHRGIPHDERVCRMCACSCSYCTALSPPVEDLRHLLVECPSIRAHPCPVA
jgi:hypothetical protein